MFHSKIVKKKTYHRTLMKMLGMTFINSKVKDIPWKRKGKNLLIFEAAVLYQAKELDVTKKRNTI